MSFFNLWKRTKKIKFEKVSDFDVVGNSKKSETV